MRKVKFDIAIIIMSFAIVVGILKCTLDLVAGGTETGDAMGVLYNPNGTPAANAKVFAIPIDYNPLGRFKNKSTIVDSTTTNDNGEYSFDSLPQSFYNILGKGDSGLCYNDSIFIYEDTTNSIPPDTLECPGSLHGAIRLQPGDDSRTVIILVFGTKTWTAPIDSIGNFALENMAEGTYNVRFLTTLDDYSPLDTNLTIRAGMEDTLSDTLYMPFTGIPVPTGLKLSYDTLRQIVTLTWNMVDTNLIGGYNVYRAIQGESFTLMTDISLVKTDTIYGDTGIEIDTTYGYKTTALDKEGNEGDFSKTVYISTINPISLKDSFGVEGTSQGQFKNINGIAISKSGKFYITDGSSLYTENMSVKVFDSNYNFLFQWGSYGTGDGEFDGPGDINIDSSGYLYIADARNHRIQKFDSSGNFILKFGEYGDGDGQLHFPSNIAIDELNNLYISDWGNRIQKFDSSGNFLISWDCIDQNNNNGLNITGVEINKEGNIVVLDEELPRVITYDSVGNLISQWGEVGSIAGKLSNPTEIAIDSIGRYYIFNQSPSYRLQIFKPDGEFILQFIIPNDCSSIEIGPGSKIYIATRTKILVY